MIKPAILLQPSGHLPLARARHQRRSTSAAVAATLTSPRINVDTQHTASFNLDWSFSLLSRSDAYTLLKDARMRVAILDVRNVDEYEAGHLVGAVNVPVGVDRNPEESMPLLDDFLRDQGFEADVIIAHCMFSIKRGPITAKALQKRLKHFRSFRNQVYLLSGGIAGFMELYSNDHDLVWLPDPKQGWKPVTH